MPDFETPPYRYCCWLRLVGLAPQSRSCQSRINPELFRAGDRDRLPIFRGERRSCRAENVALFRRLIIRPIFIPGVLPGGADAGLRATYPPAQPHRLLLLQFPPWVPPRPSPLRRLLPRYLWLRLSPRRLKQPPLRQAQHLCPRSSRLRHLFHWVKPRWWMMKSVVVTSATGASRSSSPARVSPMRG